MTDFEHPVNCRNCELDGDPSFCGADPGNREPYACDMCDRYELDLATLRAKLAAERIGLIARDQADIWRIALRSCPGHADLGSRSWCAYCGDMKKESGND